MLVPEEVCSVGEISDLPIENTTTIASSSMTNSPVLHQFCARSRLLCIARPGIYSLSFYVFVSLCMRLCFYVTQSRKHRGRVPVTHKKYRAHSTWLNPKIVCKYCIHVKAQPTARAHINDPVLVSSNKYKKTRRVSTVGTEKSSGSR